MKQRTLLFILFSILLIVSNGTGQTNSDVSKVGITAAPFLEIGVGAKATAMGGAYVGIANDVSALFWNPAGVARINGAAGIFSHINWIGDINFDYVGFIYSTGSVGTFGASITSLSMDDMLVRTEERPQGTGEYFNSGDICMALTYAMNLTDRFSLGITGKYIRQQIWKETAQGMAIDIGTLFTTGFHGMRIGATLSNFGTDMKMTGEDLIEYHDIDKQQMGNNDQIFAELKTDSWPLPLNFQVGVAMEIVQNEYHRVTVAVDALQPTGNTECINFGMEYGMKEWVFLRAGYRSLFQRDAEEGLTFGAGANMKFIYNLPVRIDYSFADFGRLQDIHCFSLAIEL